MNVAMWPYIFYSKIEILSLVDNRRVYIPGTQMTLVLIIKDLVFEDAISKTRGK